jgi:predicted Zn-dependent protease
MDEAVLETKRDAPDCCHIQVDGRRISDYVAAQRLNEDDAYRRLYGLTTIVITGADIYLPSQPGWRYAFGMMRDYATQASGESAGIGVISYFRMDNRVYGLRPDKGRLNSRLRKLVTKYVGVMHYELETTPDPDSVLYNSILGVDDLDHMGERLPLPR